VLILTRETSISHLSTVTVAPITSTIRGVPSEVILDLQDGMKARCAVNLHNVVTNSATARRAQSRVAERRAHG
jgi:mRNA interferase MazF